MQKKLQKIECLTYLCSEIKKSSKVMDNNNQVIIYQTADNQTQIDVRLENETVWLTYQKTYGL